MQIWKVLLLVSTIFCVTALYYFKNFSTSLPLEPSRSVAITNTSGDRACPIRNFVFVKTHKTGSSTLANILMRYTENKKLNILVSRYPHGTNYASDLSIYYFPPPPPGETYNAFMMHARIYNPTFLRSHLPLDTRFFTIIRHPVSRYISGMGFFQVADMYDKHDMDRAINMHLDENSGYLNTTTECNNCHYVLNSVATDLGFDYEGYFSASDRGLFVEQFISSRERELDIFLLTEHFDLSLMLLRRRYCLTFEDLNYMRSLESVSGPVVREETKKRILEFQPIDAAIYEYFNKTFWELVSREEGILEEETMFQEHNAQRAEVCSNGKILSGYGLYEQNLTDFGRSDFQCLAMASRVLPFVYLLEKRNQGLKNDRAHREGYLNLQDVYTKRYGT